MTAAGPAGATPGLQSVAPGLTGRPWISQDWLDVVFVHWRVDVSAVAPLLPAGTRPDTMALDGTDDGVTTWVGLIGFRFEDTRFPPLGRWADRAHRRLRRGERARLHGGRPGTARRGVPVARRREAPADGRCRVATGLPYWWANAESRTGDGRVGYAMRRHGTHLRSMFDVQVGAGDRGAEPRSRPS